ncbi:shikimate dehydrogenase family protein [Salinisphaera hydrothermalis]|uniref:shikimate dehydrogenase family protein n=1 Tax=Salinisphaera hydrothermalis TaxID=563188 RepID=UPI003342CCD2
MTRQLEAAERPTFYFIGVTTAQSSIMRVFPEWAQYLQLGDCEIRGIDFPIETDPSDYRDAIAFIKGDPLSLGALVTTHKINLFKDCRDLFDEIDPHAELMGETSCLSKRNGRLICHAKDPISSGLALNGFVPDNHFADTEASVFIMGAGGSAMAMSWHLTQPSKGKDRPTEVIISDPDPDRLGHIDKIAGQLSPDIPIRLVRTEDEQTNDRVLSTLPPASLVVNATGLGKDRPGSPLTAPEFPSRALVWELNYRGELDFLAQARAQENDRALHVEDGWTYFIHGWSCVIAEVFDVDIPSAGPVFEQMSSIAQGARHAGKAS